MASNKLIAVSNSNSVPPTKPYLIKNNVAENNVAESSIKPIIMGDHIINIVLEEKQELSFTLIMDGITYIGKHYFSAISKYNITTINNYMDYVRPNMLLNRIKPPDVLPAVRPFDSFNEYYELYVPIPFVGENDIIKLMPLPLTDIQKLAIMIRQNDKKLLSLKSQLDSLIIQINKVSS
jgi:hypothetical protein